MLCMNGLRLREIRKKCRFTQKEFAKIIGVGERTLQNWEAGAKIPAIKYAMLRDVLSENDEQICDDANSLVVARLNEYLRSKDVSKRELASRLSLKESNLAKKLRGELRLDLATLIQILEVFPNLNAAWLLRGEGSAENLGRDEEKSEEYVNFEKRIAFYIDKCEVQRTLLAERDARIRELEEELLTLKKQAK